MPAEPGVPQVANGAGKARVSPGGMRASRGAECPALDENGLVASIMRYFLSGGRRLVEEALETD